MTCGTQYVYSTVYLINARVLTPLKCQFWPLRGIPGQARFIAFLGRNMSFYNTVQFSSTCVPVLYLQYCTVQAPRKEEAQQEASRNNWTVLVVNHCNKKRSRRLKHWTYTAYDYFSTCNIIQRPEYVQHEADDEVSSESSCNEEDPRGRQAKPTCQERWNCSHWRGQTVRQSLLLWDR